MSISKVQNYLLRTGKRLMDKTIDDLINEINGYSANGKSEPTNIKILLGYDVYNPNNRVVESYCKSTNISIYKDFEQVAFLMEDLSFQSSEIFVLGLMLRSLDAASIFLDKLKNISYGYVKFVEYLYYEKGIVLINRNTKSNLFKNMKSKPITHVLNIGKEMCKKVYKELSKHSGIKMAQCLHCSPINLASLNRDKYYSIWFKYEDIYLNQIQIAPMLSLKDFYIL